MKKPEYTVSSGNVFADLGFADAKTMLVKAGLALQITRAIRAAGITQQDAADRMGISQAKVSKLIRGDLFGISDTKLQQCLNALGQDVTIVVSEHKGKGKVTTAAS